MPLFQCTKSSASARQFVLWHAEESALALTDVRLIVLIAETPFPKMNLLRSMICVSNFKHQLDMATRRVHTYKWDYACKCDIDLSERSWQNQAFVRLVAGYGLRSLLEKLLDLSPHNLNVVDSRG